MVKGSGDAAVQIALLAAAATIILLVMAPAMFVSAVLAPTRSTPAKRKFNKLGGGQNPRTSEFNPEVLLLFIISRSRKPRVDCAL